MHKTLPYLMAVLLSAVLVSCGTSSKTVENNFYNKANELKVTSKKGLFSSRHYTFGTYSTGDRQNSVDKQIINFSTQRAPFRFSFNDANGSTTSVQEVYTDRMRLKD